MSAEQMGRVETALKVPAAGPLPPPLPPAPPGPSPPPSHCLQGLPLQGLHEQSKFTGVTSRASAGPKGEGHEEPHTTPRVHSNLPPHLDIRAVSCDL